MQTYAVCVWQWKLVRLFHKTKTGFKISMHLDI